MRIINSNIFYLGLKTQKQMLHGGAYASANTCKNSYASLFFKFINFIHIFKNNKINSKFFKMTMYFSQNIFFELFYHFLLNK